MDVPANAIERKFKQAISHLKKREIDQGMSLFDEIIAMDPRDKSLLISVYKWYGLTFEHLKKYEKALESYDYELSLHKLSGNSQGFADASKRIANLAMNLGNVKKARRVAEELVDFAVSAQNEELVSESKAFLVSICLDELEHSEEDKTGLLAVCSQQFENAELPAELSAKFLGLSGRSCESREKYQMLIDRRIREKQFQGLSGLYYEMAIFSEDSDLLCMIYDLTNAVLYACQHDSKREQTFYKFELSKRLLAYGSSHQASIQSLEALKNARELEDDRMIIMTILTLAQSLRALGEVRKAAYFIVLGSVLVLESEDKDRKLDAFYEQMDELMTQEKLETQKEFLCLDSSGDPARNEAVARFVVRLEHTTTVDTWKMIVKGISEQNKENEPADLFDLLCSMSTRMEDQRTALPVKRAEEPRPESSASNKTTKSNGVLPALSQIANAKIGKILNRKKSKMSVKSN